MIEIKEGKTYYILLDANNYKVTNIYIDKITYEREDVHHSLAITESGNWHTIPSKKYDCEITLTNYLGGRKTRAIIETHTDDGEDFILCMWPPVDNGGEYDCDGWEDDYIYENEEEAKQERKRLILLEIEAKENDIQKLKTEYLQL
jgi:hypothetical protein